MWEFDGCGDKSDARGGVVELELDKDGCGDKSDTRGDIVGLGLDKN